MMDKQNISKFTGVDGFLPGFSPESPGPRSLHVLGHNRKKGCGDAVEILGGHTIAKQNLVQGKVFILIAKSNINYQTFKEFKRIVKSSLGILLETT